MQVVNKVWSPTINHGFSSQSRDMFMEIPYSGFTINLEYVIYGILAYGVGLITVMLVHRLRHSIGDRYLADDTVVQAVVIEYTRRLKVYDRIIAEMRAKLDIVEIKTQTLAQQATVTSLQQLQPHQPQLQPHTQPVSEVLTVTQHAQVTEPFEGQNGTTDYILKLLLEGPRSSRDVQNAIGRTREHTARLMKKLHVAGLVSRDLNVKPFRYTITELGRMKLKERTLQPVGLQMTA